MQVNLPCGRGDTRPPAVLSGRCTGQLHCFCLADCRPYNCCAI